MRKLFRKARRWSETHPFTTAVIVVLVIVTPGFFRLEQITDRTDETARTVASSEERSVADEIEEDLLSCQTRNTFQKNTREKFNAFIDAVEVAFVSQAETPQRADAIRIFTGHLRDSVDTDPEDEDRDCNGDKKFDAVDYLPG